MNEGLPGWLDMPGPLDDAWLDSPEPQGTTAPARFARGTSGGPAGTVLRIHDLETALHRCVQQMRRHDELADSEFHDARIIAEIVLTSFRRPD